MPGSSINPVAATVEYLRTFASLRPAERRALDTVEAHLVPEGYDITAAAREDLRARFGDEAFPPEAGLSRGHVVRFHSGTPSPLETAVSPLGALFERSRGAKDEFIPLSVAKLLQILYENLTAGRGMFHVTDLVTDDFQLKPEIKARLHLISLAEDARTYLRERGLSIPEPELDLSPPPRRASLGLAEDLPTPARIAAAIESLRPVYLRIADEYNQGTRGRRSSKTAGLGEIVGANDEYHSFWSGVEISQEGAWETYQALFENWASFASSLSEDEITALCIAMEFWRERGGIRPSALSPRQQVIDWMNDTESNRVIEEHGEEWEKGPWKEHIAGLERTMEQGERFIPNRGIGSLDPLRRPTVLILGADNGLGIPKEWGTKYRLIFRDWNEERLREAVQRFGEHHRYVVIDPIDASGGYVFRLAREAKWILEKDISAEEARAEFIAALDKYTPRSYVDYDHSFPPATIDEFPHLADSVGRIDYVISACLLPEMELGVPIRFREDFEGKYGEEFDPTGSEAELAIFKFADVVRAAHIKAIAHYLKENPKGTAYIAAQIFWRDRALLGRMFPYMRPSEGGPVTGIDQLWRPHPEVQVVPNLGGRWIYEAFPNKGITQTVEAAIVRHASSGEKRRRSGTGRHSKPDPRPSSRARGTLGAHVLGPAVMELSSSSLALRGVEAFVAL